MWHAEQEIAALPVGHPLRIVFVAEINDSMSSPQFGPWMSHSDEHSEEPPAIMGKPRSRFLGRRTRCAALFEGTFIDTTMCSMPAGQPSGVRLGGKFCSRVAELSQ